MAVSTQYLNPAQQRTAEPTAFENKLGDALEAIFMRREYELAQIVSSLNATEVFDEDGSPWTEASFCAVMERLGA
jgi:hypothetical protein